MNLPTNVTLQVLATGLIATGITTLFNTNWITGTVAILLGIGLYAAYEYFPTK